jgi:replicative DNA helicase
MSTLSQLKAPPHNDEAETLVLSAMINDNRLINDLDWLTAEDFYRLESKTIFNRLGMMAMVGQPVDPVTLVDSLEAAGELVGNLDADYIVDLLMSGRGGTNIQHYAQIVRQHSVSRKLVSTGFKISEIGYEAGDTQDKIDSAQTLIMDFATKGENEPRIIDDILREAVEDIDRRCKAGGEVVGLKSGFHDLDRLTAGFQPGQLIIIAGRPAMGKTTFAMNIVENVIQQGKTVLVFNLEMTAVNLVMKSLASMGSMPYNLLRSGKIDDHGSNLTAGAAKLMKKALHIDDNGSLTSQQVLSRARKVQQKIGRPLDLVVVDYLQLLNDKGEGHNRITQISRALKMTARQLGCPVIALSQLNRSLEQRPNKRPIMADLRESGAIEQDADTIVMLYRDEEYNKETEYKGIAEAIIRKNREGENATVYLASQLDMCRFKSMDQSIVPRQTTQVKPSAFAHLDR